MQAAWLANATRTDEVRAALKRIVTTVIASEVIGSIRAMFKKDSQDKVWLDSTNSFAKFLRS
jgi:hypothetical protein